MCITKHHLFQFDDGPHKKIVVRMFEPEIKCENMRISTQR